MTRLSRKVPLRRPFQNLLVSRELFALWEHTYRLLCTHPEIQIDHKSWNREITLDSAPEAPVIFSAILRRLIPRVKFIFLEWILKMSTRAYDNNDVSRPSDRYFETDQSPTVRQKKKLTSSFGAGNSIFRSILPGRRRAESKISILFVAMITLIFCCGSNPSNWFNNSNIVRWTSESPPPPDSIRVLKTKSVTSVDRMRSRFYKPQKFIFYLPMESISSMKMIDGECSLAIMNNSRTILEPSPINFWTSSEPETLYLHFRKFIGSVSAAKHVKCNPDKCTVGMMGNSSGE